MSSLAARLRSEPYRVFFPLAALLGAAGVGWWILFWRGWAGGYHGQAHALIQSQAFLMAFVAGFLMTMIPRRLATRQASMGEMATAIAGLVGMTLFAFRGEWLASQACALLVVGTLLVFGLRRFRAAPGRRMPDAFVLLPFGLVFGVAGGILVALQVFDAPAWTNAVGRGLVQEAQFLALILGAGHLVLPILTGNPPPPDGDDSAASRRRRLAHVGVGLAILAGVLLERLGGMAFVRAGLLVKACAFLVDALWCLHALRWPRLPGLHRRLAWISFWLVPSGLLLAAAMPAQRIGALHVTFIGGFALLSFAVAMHVIASHGGAAGVVKGRPVLAWAFGLLFLVAMATRVSADFLPKSYLAHLGWAAALWMLGLLAWAVLLVPIALRAPPTPASTEPPVIQPAARDGAGGS